MRGLALRAEAHHLAARIRPLPRPAELSFDISGQTPVIADGEVVGRGQPLTRVPREAVPLLAPLAGRVVLAGSKLRIITAGRQPAAAVGRPAHRNEVLARLRACAVVGLGGGAFPLHAKIGALQGRRLRLMIVNAVECDPHLASDAALMRSTSGELGLAIETLAAWLEPERLVIAVKPREREIAARWRGVGGAEIDVVPPLYPAGAETVLMARHLDAPLGPGERPTERGALCMNIATLHAAYLAIRFAQPCTTRLVTVTGYGRGDGVYRVPFGTPLGALVPGGDVLIGGSMMGRAPSRAALPAVDPTCNGLHVPPRRSAPSPCIRCSACLDVCPAGLAPERVLREIETCDLEGAAAARLDACIGCRACDVVCPSGIPLASRFAAAQSALARRRSAEERATRALARWQRRERRLAASNADDRDARRRRLAARRRGA